MQRPLERSPTPKTPLKFGYVHLYSSNFCCSHTLLSRPRKVSLEFFKKSKIIIILRYSYCLGMWEQVKLNQDYKKKHLPDCSRKTKLRFLARGACQKQPTPPSRRRQPVCLWRGRKIGSLKCTETSFRQPEIFPRFINRVLQSDDDRQL